MTNLVRCSNWALIVAVVACADTVTHPVPSTDLPAGFIQSLSAAGGVYVLGRVEVQTSDPITIFDHQCTGGHLVTTMSDTLILYADGTAHRGTVTTRLLDGVVQSSTLVSLNGAWGPLSAQTPVFYYSDGPSIALNLVSPGGAVTPMLRVGGDTLLTTLASMGGSCPGSPSDGRQAEFAYTRR